MLVPTLSPAGRVQEELDRVLGPGRSPRLEDQRSLPYTNAVLHEVQRFITLLPHVPRCMAADTQLGGYLLPKVGTPLLDSDRAVRALPPPSLPPSFCSGPGQVRLGVSRARLASWGDAVSQCTPLGGGVSGPAHLLPHPQGTPVIPLLSSVLLDKTQWETPHQFNPGHFLDAEGRFVKRAAFLPFSAGTHSPRGWGQHGAPRPQVAWSRGTSEAQAQARWASPCPQPLATQLCPSELARIPVTADLALRPPPLQALPRPP